MTILGADNYPYKEIPGWAQLPDGRDLGEVIDVAVDMHEHVNRFLS